MCSNCLAVFLTILSVFIFIRSQYIKSVVTQVSTIHFISFELRYRFNDYMMFKWHFLWTHKLIELYMFHSSTQIIEKRGSCDA